MILEAEMEVEAQAAEAAEDAEIASQAGDEMIGVGTDPEGESADGTPKVEIRDVIVGESTAETTEG